MGGKFYVYESSQYDFIICPHGLSDIPPEPIQMTEQPGAEAYLSYISEGDAMELADQCIAKQLDLGETSWDTSTHIYETVRFYDPLGAVNAYLFRVKTEQAKDGYRFSFGASSPSQKLYFARQSIIL